MSESPSSITSKSRCLRELVEVSHAVSVGCKSCGLAVRSCVSAVSSTVLSADKLAVVETGVELEVTAVRSVRRVFCAGF